MANRNNSNKNTSEANVTPLMKQYNHFKTKYPDAILLFRVGDFYETFGQDAVVAAGVLGITLTKRHNGSASETELAGFPHHALDTYLPKLVRAGYRAAVCDQLEDPKFAKGIVKRGITELVTPGVALSDKMLDHHSNNYLAAVYFGKQDMGIALADVSTGEFWLSEGSPEYIEKTIQSFQPSEILYPKPRQRDFKAMIPDSFYIYPLDEWIFERQFGEDVLLRHFGLKNLRGFGIEETSSGVVAAGAIIHYLKETEHPNLQHLTALARVKPDRYVWLDRFTIRNLELLQSTHDSGTPLIKILDKTVSPMGARLLKKWLVLPLKEVQPIEERLSLVDFILENEDFAHLLIAQLRQIGDIERLIAKIPLGKANPRQLVQLKNGLMALEPIKAACEQSQNPYLQRIAEQIDPCASISQRIERELVEDAPPALGKGDVFKHGVAAELDDLRQLQHSGKERLLEIEQREIQNTGIKSLKIGFNNVFGYYLEVRNTYKDQVPKTWLRKQTLAQAERYITEELKKYEDKILGAEEKIAQIEAILFEDLVSALLDYIKPIQHNAAIIAKLDCLHAFALLARKNNYCRPHINDSFSIDIKKGRHPVIEAQLQLGEEYVANDVFLDADKQQILLITGPNMAGKSALLRQTALIVLMAQIGCYVPAEAASIGWVDKIFTRVGASDNISSGESTFMVEMTETASIMHNISPRSLILLDEIGRGTSTYDGISIAWALAEYLHTSPKAQPKTLFATHYHELTELAEKFERIKNFTITVREMGNKVIFLRTLVEGAAERSFGIHVAQMAGMPVSIVQRANEILSTLEQKHIEQENPIKSNLKQLARHEPQYQMSIFDMSSPELQRLKAALEALDLNTLTPIEALMKLNELKKMLG